MHSPRVHQIARRLLFVCNPDVKWREKGQTRTLEHSLESRRDDLRDKWQEAKIAWHEDHEARLAFETLAGVLIFSKVLR